MIHIWTVWCDQTAEKLIILRHGNEKEYIALIGFWSKIYLLQGIPLTHFPLYLCLFGNVWEFWIMHSCCLNLLTDANKDKLLFLEQVVSFYTHATWIPVQKFVSSLEVIGSRILRSFDGCLNLFSVFLWLDIWMHILRSDNFKSQS